LWQFRLDPDVEPCRESYLPPLVEPNVWPDVAPYVQSVVETNVEPIVERHIGPYLERSVGSLLETVVRLDIEERIDRRTDPVPGQRRDAGRERPSCGLQDQSFAESFGHHQQGPER
jgi:hypothetical protein